MKKNIILLVVFILSGCANINFNADDNGAVYYEPLPYLFYSVTDKCVSSATVVTLPGKKRHLKFTSGYGSSDLSAEFSNGLLTKVGQTSDTKVPETLTSISGLIAANFDQNSVTTGCSKSILFPIENGVPNLQKPLDLNLGQ